MGIYITLFGYYKSFPSTGQKKSSLSLGKIYAQSVINKYDMPDNPIIYTYLW